MLVPEIDRSVLRRDLVRRTHTPPSRWPRDFCLRQGARWPTGVRRVLAPDGLRPTLTSLRAPSRAGAGPEGRLSSGANQGRESALPPTPSPGSGRLRRTDVGPSPPLASASSKNIPLRGWRAAAVADPGPQALQPCSSSCTACRRSCSRRARHRDGCNGLGDFAHTPEPPAQDAVDEWPHLSLFEAPAMEAPRSQRHPRPLDADRRERQPHRLKRPHDSAHCLNRLGALRFCRHLPVPQLLEHRPVPRPARSPAQSCTLLVGRHSPREQAAACSPALLPRLVPDARGGEVSPPAHAPGS